MTPLTPSGAPEIAWPAIAAVALVTVGATLIHWWLKGRGLLPSPTNPIRIVAMRSLGGKKSIAVVEVERERFLLGMTDEAVALLSRLPNDATATASGTVVAFPAGAVR